ncbi:unnamed protein product [Dibothriocephalus latus]|uniref:Uncharacterized protein n=1 Tax=Dibothriocephalus latus TaxID=60516 RepID=A0A3P7P0L5_DIBLA|nr:unnamed protein product [Dibothriocephalus latus]
MLKYGRSIIRVLFQDCHTRLRKYCQGNNQEETRCCHFVGEGSPKLLQQRVAERAREKKAIREAAQENKFRELHNPTSSIKGILVNNLSLKKLKEEQIQVLKHEASSNTADAKPANMSAAVELVINQAEATE